MTSPFLRFVLPDSHGKAIDPQARAAVIRDAKICKPKQVVFLGDGADVSGVFSNHSAQWIKELGYSYKEDLDAHGELIEDVRHACGDPEVKILEGNHEHHLERWLAKNLTNKTDAKVIRNLVAPDALLKFKQKGIKYYRRAEFYDGLSINGTFKWGKCHFTHGFTAAKFATAMHVARYGSNIVHGHCFSDDTELLSPTGWVCVDQVEEGMPVATLDPISKELVFQSVQAKYVYDDYSQMYKFQSNAMDHLVTADHTMVYGENRLIRKAAKDLHTSSYFYVAGKENRIENFSWSSEEIRLWVQCITDGYCDHGRWIWHLKKPRKIQALTKLLTDMGIPYTQSSPGKTGAVKIYVGRLNERYTKELTGLARTFSVEQVRTLLQEWSRTDGTTYKDAVQLCTSIQRHADLLQELAIRSGHKCNLSSKNNCYALSIRWDVNRVFCHSTYAKGPTTYSGRAWCVSVPNGTLFARRNGKVLVTGNTHRAQSYITRTVSAGIIGGWSPGCLSKLQPLYMHCSPTEWSLGYGLQWVEPNGTFLHINVPIINGKTMVAELLKTIKVKRVYGR